MVDRKERKITTVTAVPISASEAAENRDNAEQKEELLLSIMKAQPRGSMRDWAKVLGWVSADGTTLVSQVQRTMEVLLKKKLVDKNGRSWELTPKGKKRAPEWRCDPELGLNAKEVIG